MEKEEKKEEKSSFAKATADKCEEYLDGWKRERADFLNYKKDEMERIGQLIKYSSEEMILKILPILDHFNIAEKHLTDEQKEDGHVKGLLQIKQQLEEFLKNSGVEEVKAEIGDKFDPNVHEATEEAVAPARNASGIADAGGESKESDTIVEVVRKGYNINGHLLRPAKVKISK